MKNASSAHLCGLALCVAAVLAHCAATAADGAPRDKQTAYVMVYHKDADHSLHMAVSDDSYSWRAVNGDKAVIRGEDIAVQKGIRDPHIARTPDGVYVVAATDLHIFARQRGFRKTEWERDGKKYAWGNNRGLVLLTSRDLVNWKTHNIDFSALKCKTQAKDADGNDIPWSEVGCTWAPELVWDDDAGSFFMHFTTRFGNGKNQIYGVHLKRDLTGLAEDPFPLYSAPRDENGQPRYNIIDSDMVRDDEGLWHLFYVSHEHGASIRHVTGRSLRGPFEDAPYFDGERRGHEAPSCWRRPDGTWVVMWDCYSMRPHNFGFVETKDFREWKPIGYFDDRSSPMKRTGFSEQKHGAIVEAPAALVHALERHYAGEASAAGETAISLRPREKGPEVPNTLYGIFFEDINYSADGGIYPELVANRGFDWDNGSTHGWENDFRGDAQARVSIEHGRPVHEVTASHVRIDAYGAGGGKGAGLRNRGYHGMYVEKGKKYDLSFYVRGIDGYKGGVRVVLEADGRVLAEKRVANSAMNVGRPRGAALFPELPEWTRVEAVFEPSETTRKATLSILADSAGIVEFEQVSLFPQDTFNGRKNGLRKDLVQMLKDLKPGIMRFPGGCLVEGRDWNLWYDWKISVGDGSLESRRCIWNTWDYWQTMGLGYFEYFCLCEDLGCEPLPVMASGLTCQFAKPVDAAPMDSMPYFAQNLLDLIEFANGDVSTKWGALRAKMGHPKPFNMKYLGIGNENWDQVFLDRFEAIAKIIREKHPEIRIVSSSGPAPDGHSFDYAWKRLDTKLADVIDEHYYKPPEWFREQGGRYDGYDRSGNKPNVYAGEYACHVKNRDNNLYSALCEAGAMTGFERNCDVVEMTSYAPLFAKVDSYKWKPDLIWFDNAGCFGTPNYYVQQMFGVNRPSRIVPSSETVSGDAAFSCEGELALHTWNTAAEFKDIKVIDGTGKKLLSTMPDPSKCTIERGGRWTLAGGVLRQENTGATDTALTLPCGTVGDATVTFKARRTAGSEGFLFRFRAKDGRHAHVNFGGWMNTEHGIEALGFSASLPPRVAGSLENNRWYNVKVVLRGDTVTASLDGREIFSAARVTERAQKEFFHVCGFDAEKGELVVKCVNISDEARPLTIDFGTALKPGEAKRIELSGKSGEVNDLANPRRVAPVEKTFRFAGGRVLKTELAPNSLTVFRLRASL